ncbi:mannitol dehydrogenase family protein [Endozoicomonadaceae bacterium StTr2]
MPQLNQQLQLPSSVDNFSYDHSRLQTGIVHLGLGAFHRAHQALYTHDVINLTGKLDWGICAANIRSNHQLVNILKQQDNLYTVTEYQADGKPETRVCGAIVDTLFSRPDPYHLLHKMADPDTRIVSLTITEKGYYLNPASRELQLDHPDIQHDIASPDQPYTAAGMIVNALNKRRKSGIPPFTIMSCDNIPENGTLTRQAVVQLADKTDPDLASWIRENVAFPSTMIDRIVPATTPEDLKQLEDRLGFRDGAAVITEYFRQWIIEDNFPLGRPDWDLVDGARFVSDVRPYEQMKLRMLNGSHSFLAYLGYLAGYRTIADTISDPVFYTTTRQFMCSEAAISLEMPDAVNLEDYADQLLKRYRNPGLKHKNAQIAMDGSQKIPQRWLDTIRWHLQRNSNFDCLASGVAGWMRYITGNDEQGQSIELSDPMQAELQGLFKRYIDSPSDYVAAVIKLDAVFGTDLGQHPHFIATIQKAYHRLLKQGAAKAVAALSTRQEYS